MPRLTTSMIAAITIPAGKREAWMSDDEVVGLRIRATAGRKTFFACWTDPATAERRRQKLGFFGAITLDQARIAARAVFGDVAKGGDPISARAERRATAERARAEAALTLEVLVDEWANLHLSRRRPSYAREAVRAIKFAFHGRLAAPATALSKSAVVNVLDALAAAGKAAIAARTLAYGRACYSWAQKRDKVPSNPFSGLPVPAGVVARERVLTDAELGRVWIAAKNMAPPFGPLFCMLLLSLARREEVAGMRWSELSADLQTWTIPGARMKKGKVHISTLPDVAREVLAAVPRIDGQDLVFSTTGRTPVSGFTRAKRALDIVSGVTDWRLHDIRRTGVSALARFGINPVIADKLLAHEASTLHGAARVYQRHDFQQERAAALATWAAHVLQCGNPEHATASNVARLQDRRRVGAIK